jgi:hypothetical protein
LSPFASVLMTFEWKGQQVAKDMKKIKTFRDFEFDYFPSILGAHFQSGLKIPFLIIRVFLWQWMKKCSSSSITYRWHCLRPSSIYRFSLTFWYLGANTANIESIPGPIQKQPVSNTILLPFWYLQYFPGSLTNYMLIYIG